MDIIFSLREQVGKPVCLNMVDGHRAYWGILRSADYKTIEISLVGNNGENNGKGCIDATKVSGFIIDNDSVNKACLTYLYNYYPPKPATHLSS